MNRLFPVLLAALIVSVATAEDGPRPLSLPEAIRLALKNNPDLATAQQHVNAARAGIQQTEAALWPQVRLSGSYAASDNPVQAFMMTLNQRALNLASANFNQIQINIRKCPRKFIIAQTCLGVSLEVCMLAFCSC